MNTCATCQYTRKSDTGPRECHLYPKQVTVLLLPVQGMVRPGGPAFQLRGHSAFPGVEDTDWCGQYQPKIALSS